MGRFKIKNSPNCLLLILYVERVFFCKVLEFRTAVFSILQNTLSSPYAKTERARATKHLLPKTRVQTLNNKTWVGATTTTTQKFILPIFHQNAFINVDGFLVVSAQVVDGREAELVFNDVLELLVVHHESVFVVEFVRQMKEKPRSQRRFWRLFCRLFTREKCRARNWSRNFFKSVNHEKHFNYA